ncbi:MAG: Spo0E family sporulation regulatory protein-aspartic acid phosphatase [Bacillota bacterium]
MGEFTKKSLKEEIEYTRQYMIFAGLEYGLTDPITISLSTKLDGLLNDLWLYESNPIHTRDIQKCSIHA